MVTPAENGEAYGFWGTLVGGAWPSSPAAIVAFCYQYFLHRRSGAQPPDVHARQPRQHCRDGGHARLKHWNILGYVRLTIPRPDEVLLAVASPAALLVLQLVIANLTGRFFRMPVPDFTLAFLLSILVVSPLAEEVVLRGFMYPGLARSVIEPWGAILLLAMVFAVLHEGPPFSHFCSGLLYGWLRWRTGSVSVPILAHAASNFGVLLVGLQGYGWIGF